MRTHSPPPSVLALSLVCVLPVASAISQELDAGNEKASPVLKLEVSRTRVLPFEPVRFVVEIQNPSETESIPLSGYWRSHVDLLVRRGATWSELQTYSAASMPAPMDPVDLPPGKCLEWSSERVPLFLTRTHALPLFVAREWQVKATLRDRTGVIASSAESTIQVEEPDPRTAGKRGDYDAYIHLMKHNQLEPASPCRGLVFYLAPHDPMYLQSDDERQKVHDFIARFPVATYSLYLRRTLLALQQRRTFRRFWTDMDNTLLNEYRKLLQTGHAGFVRENPVRDTQGNLVDFCEPPR